MKKIKLMLALCMLMVCGCRYMNEDKSFTLDEVEVSIIEYMETKYGQKFELVDIGYNSIISKEVNARVISLEDERRNEISVYWFYEDGKELIDDNYTRLIYKLELNDFMDQQVKIQFNEVNYITYSNIADSIPIEKYDKTVSFSEISKNYDIDIWTIILLDESSLEKEEEIKQKILRLYEEIKKDTTSDVKFGVSVLVCDNTTFEENRPLVEEYKKMFSLDRRDASLTYNKPDRVILKTFSFTTNDIKRGVTIR